MQEIKPDIIGLTANLIVKGLKCFSKKESIEINDEETIQFIEKTTKLKREDIIKVLDAEFLFLKIKGVAK